jgi:hypothetical protein
MLLSRVASLALAVALAGSISGCVSGGVDTPQLEASTPTSSTVPCYGGFVADGDSGTDLVVNTNVEGAATPELAAEAWARSASAPEGAPTEGWKAQDDRQVVSGDWILAVTPTASGDGWVVSGQGCL